MQSNSKSLTMPGNASSAFLKSFWEVDQTILFDTFWNIVLNNFVFSPLHLAYCLVDWANNFVLMITVPNTKHYKVSVVDSDSWCFQFMV